MNINATLFAQLIVFLILVVFTIKFVWPPIVKALDERANKIAEGLAAAERGKSDAEQAEKRVAETLAEGRQQVAELVANADKRAAQIVEEARTQASEEAARCGSSGPRRRSGASRAGGPSKAFPPTGPETRKKSLRERSFSRASGRNTPPPRTSMRRNRAS